MCKVVVFSSCRGEVDWDEENYKGLSVEEGVNEKYDDEMLECVFNWMKGGEDKRLNVEEIKERIKGKDLIIIVEEEGATIIYDYDKCMKDKDMMRNLNMFVGSFFTGYDDEEVNKYVINGY